MTDGLLGYLILPALVFGALALAYLSEWVGERFTTQR